ncbi:sucrase-isomaltase, intestinal-like [Paramacrobiotus metropolitanus]|uniref:sucrase-isomaltase, intestinal-like n=1 Tax=Paramacrobiotus metropolitanus TaxID=2943436 RepID=UPI002445E1CE|nr:sucrase-isomaltase, intestinal-like [Paramacrobiotus metropolitanus]
MAAWDRQSETVDVTVPARPNDYMDLIHDTNDIIYGFESHTDHPGRVSLGHIYEDIPHYRRQYPPAPPSDASMYSTTSLTLLTSASQASLATTPTRPAQPIPVNPARKFPFHIPKKYQWALWACLVVFLVALASGITSIALMKTEEDNHAEESVEFVEGLCRRRGCQYRDEDLPVDDGKDFGPPSCYMPPSKIGYNLVNRDEYVPGDWNSVGILEAIHTPIVFDEERPPSEAHFAFRRPAFRSDYLSENTLRFQFFDYNTSRYEVPVELHNVRSTQFNPNRRQYAINITSSNPFKFRIYRRTFGSESFLLDTCIGGLVLQDQFLQFSAKLPSEHLFGLGDNRLGSLKRKMDWATWAMFNRDVDLLMMDTRGTTPKNLYGFQPFYMVIENDGKAHGVFLRNSNAMDYTLLPGNAITWRTVGGILDFYVFLGPKPEDVIQQFTALTGRTFMPPYWSLGFQIGRWGMESAEQTRQLAQRNLHEKIPFDMVFVDIDYMDERQPFTQNKTGQDFHALTTEMLERFGIHYGGVVFPSVHADANGSAAVPYTTAQEKGILVKWPQRSVGWAHSNNGLSVGGDSVLLGKAWANGRSAYVDYLNPKSAEWLQDMLHMQHTQLAAFSSLWLGIAEPSCFATNTPVKEAWFIKGRGDQQDEKTVPGYGRHWNYTLQCDPASLHERPPYKTAAIREWEDQSTKTHQSSYKKELLSSQTLCMDAVQSDGVTTYHHYDVHNIYGLTAARALFRAAKQVRLNRTLIMAKASFPGMQQYAGRWLGDISSDKRDFRYSFQWILEYSLFGNSYTGVDICGFWSPPPTAGTYLKTELCHRWTIAGAFYPLMRAHSSNVNDYHDPARMFGEKPPAYLEQVRKALDLRYRLLPYLYTLFHIAHTKGNTVMRPLHHEYTNVDMINFVSADSEQIQFMWGAALMITPVLEVREGTAFVDQVRITFPPDRFYDFFTGEVIDRERVKSQHESEMYNLTDVSIGLHGRAGHIIATQNRNEQLNTRESRKNNFTVVIFPKMDEYSSGEFFWDDGESQDTHENKNHFSAWLRYKGEDSVLYPLLPYGYWHVFILEVKQNWTGMENYFIEEIQIYGMQARRYQQVIIDRQHDRTGEFKFANKNGTKIMTITGAIPMTKTMTFLFTNDDCRQEDTYCKCDLSIPAEEGVIRSADSLK